MKYFKACEIAVKPLIIWCEFAKSLQELEELGLENDPLIKPENEIPAERYGVCPLKIVSGELVERTTGEMSAFQAENIIETAVSNEVKKIVNLDGLTFSYDGHDFPCYKSAREYYNVLEHYRVGTNRNVMKVDGTAYILPVANIDAFLEEYYKVLLAELEV